MKNLNSRELRKLILETIQEEKQRMRSSQKRYSLSSLVEEADPAKVDDARFPSRLRSTPDKYEADLLATGGKNDGEDSDDIVPQTEWSGTVGSLKPSQNSMDIAKLCNFFIVAGRKAAGVKGKDPFAAGPGGAIDCIISGDGYIMDGHHRWGALCMYDPNTQVGPDVQLQFPAIELIAALNMITKHLTGKETGKKGKTPLLEAFADTALRGQIKAFLDDPAGCWGADSDPDTLRKILGQFSGAEAGGGDANLLDAVMMKINGNLANAVLDPVSDEGGMFAREDMPVLEPDAGHVMQAAKMLARGEVDLNPPYAENIPGAAAPDYDAMRAGPSLAASSEPPTKGTNESKNNSSDVIMERWQKLAGLLKG